METDSYEENIPFGVIFFFDDFEYSEASNFCSDFDIDVHEIYNFLTPQEAFKVYKKAHTPMSLLSLT
jgi:hypothetical protein